MEALKNNRPLPTTSNIARFNPFLKNNQIRLGGRLQFAPLSADVRHPLLLEGNHPFVLLLIKDTQVRLHHLGTRIVLSELRSDFWILRGGQAIKKSTIVYSKEPSRQLSLNKVGEEELLIHTFGSTVPTRLKCARVQVKIKAILDKDEGIIEALEIDEVTRTFLEFAPIDIINELKTEGINLCDVDYGVFGRENISLLAGTDHYFNIVSGKIKRLNQKLVAIESKFGWLLMGKIEGKNYFDSNETSMSSISFFVSGSDIENLWKFETLFIRDPRPKRSQEKKLKLLL
ncbi:integrase catalytic domain-containing protein [Nephila pilipes]|uniref:Integrase catalytic domain-containing protein n=1 Tax=Nephila pilipes TaxID=299642 RepID=A0A8X6QWE0_NEPPI|nr:integrase catalytic domain-containing protein [Nephila pilipes]